MNELYPSETTKPATQPTPQTPATTTGTASLADSGSRSSTQAADLSAYTIPAVQFLFVVVVAIGFFALFKWWLRKRLFKSKKVEDWKNTEIIEIAVPKESAEQVQKETGNSIKDAKEYIGITEQLFSIMSDYAKTSEKTYRPNYERFSLEIISINEEIKFWIACNKKAASVIERQISAIYPKAHTERIINPDFFKPDSASWVQEVETSSIQELPIKTFRQIENDPLNTLTNALGGIGKLESATIQYIITPVKDDWQKEPRKLASKIRQGLNPQDVLFPDSGFGKEFAGFFKGISKGVWDTLFKSNDEDKKPSGDKKRKIDLSGAEVDLRLTPQQEELVKKLEEKASRPGFLTTIRIVGSGQTEERAKQIVDTIIPAFQLYDIKRFNGFKRKKTDQKTGLLHYLMRTPEFGKQKVLNSEELTSLWHIPNYQVTTSNIKWLAARKPPVPLNIAGPGPKHVFLGTASSRGQHKEIYIKPEDRLRHIYSLGGTGSGKSYLMTNIILQDIEMGNGVCVVDPHGELIDDVLLRIPKERKDDVIIFSPAMIDRPLGLNMLATDPRKPTQKTLVIDALFNIWDKLYDLKKTGGPMFEMYMKNSMRLVMSHPESGSTLMEIPKVLVDEDYRAFKLAMCDEAEVVDFWEKQAVKAGGDAALENMVPYITSKLAPFVSNDFIRPMVGQQKNAIDFRQAMDNNKIVLLKLEKGLIGEQSAYLVGMVMINGLLMAGMGRNDNLRYNMDGTTEEILAHERPPFFVYIDEMQNFLFDAIPSALEEIRKYKVGFYLAHQFIKQVVKQGDERIKDSIMANCANKIIYRCGADDAKYLEPFFAPDLSAADIMNPEKFTANIVMLNDGQRSTPFNLTPGKRADEIDVEFRKELIQMTKNKYGRAVKDVEQEIKDRSKLLF
jgi:hypothetical protein